MELTKEGFEALQSCVPIARRVLQLCHMSRTSMVRTTEALLAWLKELSQKTGLRGGRITRKQGESAKSKLGNERFLRHAGKIAGAPNLSTEQGILSAVRPLPTPAIA